MINQPVLLDPDVDESPEGRDVRHDARQLHPRAQVVDRVHVGIEREDLQLLPRVEALLVERFEDVFMPCLSIPTIAAAFP